MPAKKVVVEAELPEGERPPSPIGILSYELPRSTITRVMKHGIGSDDVKVAKEVPLALQTGATVFINYISALAQEVASEHGQKTISAAHVLEASKQLGWDDQQQVSKFLKSELAAYRANVEAKKAGNGPARPLRSQTAAEPAGGADGEEEAYQTDPEDEAEATQADNEEADDMVVEN